MNNFINLRIQGVSHTKMSGSITHNIRSEASRNDTNDNLNYFYDVDVDFSVGSGGNDAKDIVAVSSGTYEENLRNHAAKQSTTPYPLNHTDRNINRQIYKNLKNIYNKDRAEHNAFYKNRRHQNLKSFHGSWAEGVLTFSEQIHKDLGTKYTRDELTSVAEATIKEVCNEMGTELKYLVLHLSETTPHFHFHFKNYDKQGFSLTHKYRDKDFLSSLQDIAYKHFKALGMDRGIKKEISGSTRHQTTKQWHEMEHSRLNMLTITKKDQLAQVKEKLSVSVQTLQSQQDELKVAYTDLNQEKNALKSLRTNHDRASEQYKQLTQSIKTLQANEQATRTKWRAIKDDVEAKKDELEIVDIEVQDYTQYKSELKLSVKEYLSEHIHKDGNSYQVKNLNKFFSSLLQEFTEANGTNLKLEELSSSKKQVHLLEAKNKDIMHDYLQYQKLYSITQQSLETQSTRVDVLSSEVSKKDSQLDKLYLFLSENDLTNEYEAYLQSKNNVLDNEILTLD